jgi:hypothetical protein
MPTVITQGAASAKGYGFGARATAANYIEDVFSTYLYTGTGANQTITNGIDLSTKGGMVWLKNRSGLGRDHALYDTTRGATFDLASNSTGGQGTTPTGLTSFGTSGFSIGTLTRINNSGDTYASWTFRKQAKFFDVVTYTGNGANRNITHNLGSVPGCIIVKRTDTTAAWAVYHRSLASTQYAVLNTTAAAATGATYWNSTTPTSSVFSLGTSTDVNASGGTYVAYLFAHDAGGFGAGGADNVISCGSFTVDGSSNATITLGYEPQFVLLKASNDISDWDIYDNMRGFSQTYFAQLAPTTNFTEGSATGLYRSPSATGFQVNALGNPSKTWIYIAIRRGPMKTPTLGSTVYGAVNRTATGTTVTVNAGRVVDLSISARNGVSNGNANIVFDRMRGLNNYILTTQTSAESTGGVTDLLNSFANQTGVVLGADSTYGYINSGGMGSVINWYFTRAPGVFDIVAYTGTGANRTVSHNLGVAPEFMIVKGRSGATAWQVYSSALANTEYLVLNTTAAKATGATRWNSTTPTSSVFSLGTATEVNTSTATYIAYLFASCPRVSKVGSYTGTGAVQTIDCGFTSSARFLLIKRTDSTGDWYIWDSTRGILSGNDPYLRLNLPNAPVTTTDWVDPASSGFALSDAVGNLVNTSSATYTFLAIA